MRDVPITDAAKAAFPIFNPGGPDDELKQALQRLHSEIEANVPANRVRSIALTHLETAGMYAVKAIFQGMQAD